MYKVGAQFVQSSEWCEVASEMVRSWYRDGMQIVESWYRLGTKLHQVDKKLVRRWYQIGTNSCHWHNNGATLVSICPCVAVVVVSRGSAAFSRRRGHLAVVSCAAVTVMSRQSWLSRELWLPFDSRASQAEY